jgi:ATP phosphoribosyltransferase
MVKIALPKGKLLPATACLLHEIGLGFENYTQKSRTYRLKPSSHPDLTAKMFHEKDVPIQVAVGNYDLGICGLDWIEELLSKYPASSLVKVADLQYDRGDIYLAASIHGDTSSVHAPAMRTGRCHIVTEYPNLAETSALDMRLRRFNIFPVWGAAEAYPPENADLIVIRAKDEEEISKKNLFAIKTILSSTAFLIANQDSWQSKNIGKIMGLFTKGLEMHVKPWLEFESPPDEVRNGFHADYDEQTVWLAVPDGHQQAPTVELLDRAGIHLKGYSKGMANRRPAANLDHIKVKVIRPQDMPLQVANGHFDLAITGQDWLSDHLYRFPSSPVTKVLDLEYGKVKIVAVVREDLPVMNIRELRQFIQDGNMPVLRTASEYTNIADRYLHDNHLGSSKLIPTWGASEAFLPEDADLLIENTQTGKTLATHKLKIIDTLFESTACIIGNNNSLSSSLKQARIASLIEMFSNASREN